MTDNIEQPRDVEILIELSPEQYAKLSEIVDNDWIQSFIHDDLGSIDGGKPYTDGIRLRYTLTVSGEKDNEKLESINILLGHGALIAALEILKPQPRFNHLMDVAFTIETTHEDEGKIPREDLIQALRERVDYLEAHPNEDPFGHCDTYSIESE